MALYNCHVTRAGINMDGGVAIDLTSESPQFWGHYFAPESVKKEMLAIALVAFTTETLVQVDLEDTTNNSFIHFLALEQG